MKRIVFVFIVMVSAVCYCQEPLGKSEQCDSTLLNKEACIIKEGGYDVHRNLYGSNGFHSLPFWFEVSLFG